jgi:hypothetical protein
MIETWATVLARVKEYFKVGLWRKENRLNSTAKLLSLGHGCCHALRRQACRREGASQAFGQETHGLGGCGTLLE